MVIDNEIISLVKRMRRGMCVNDETIGLEAILAVGPGGNYLTSDHTVKEFRKELWFPKLFDRRIWSVWEADGAQDIAERAGQKVLANKHTPPPLDPAVHKAIWEVIQAADRRYGH